MFLEDLGYKLDMAQSNFTQPPAPIPATKHQAARCLSAQKVWCRFLK